MYQPRGPYGRPPYAGSQTASVPGLLGQVLGITGIGFLITATAAYVFRDISTIAGLIAFIGGFASGSFYLPFKRVRHWS